MRAGVVQYRGKVFELQYTVYSRQYKGLRRIGGGDQADIFNLIQNTTAKSPVEECSHESKSRVQQWWRIARGSKMRAT